ncbi:hypothetical protein E2320_014502 [Naja naja]|nr:hypothetical protein E2320_014502 [Naja naja]
MDNTPEGELIQSYVGKAWLIKQVLADTKAYSNRGSCVHAPAVGNTSILDTKDLKWEGSHIGSLPVEKASFQN